MKYRIKIRLEKTGVAREKVAFDLRESQPFDISAKSVGIPSLGRDDGSLIPYCRLLVNRTPSNAGIWIEWAESRKKAAKSERIELVPGFFIEFLELPEVAPIVTESLPDPEALTKFIPAEALIKEVDSTTGKIIKSALAADLLRPTVLENKWMPSERSQRREFIKRATLYYSWTVAATVSATLIGTRFNLEQTGLALLFAIPGSVSLVTGLSAALVTRGETLGIRTNFETILRTFSFLSLLIVPWSLTVHFPPIVSIFGAAVVVTIALLVLVIRFSPNSFRVVPAGGAAGALLLMAMYFGFNELKSPDSTTVPSLSAETTPVEAPAAAETAVMLVEGLSKVAQSPAYGPSPANEASPGVPAVAPEMPAALPQSPSEAIPDPLAREGFFSAVKAGNLPLVKKLVDLRAVDVSFTLDDGGSLAIHHAAARGHMLLVKYLLAKRSPINARDPNGTTPLMWAVHRKHTVVAAYLITRKADLKVVRDDGMGALELAKNTGKAPLIRLLKHPSSAARIIKAWETEQRLLEKQQKLAEAARKRKRNKQNATLQSKRLDRTIASNKPNKTDLKRKGSKRTREGK